MSESYKKLVPMAVAVAAIGVVFLIDPIPQDPSYHEFADGRKFFGVPNFWNVATNLPFLFVGLLGLVKFRRLANPALAFHYSFLSTAVAAVALGSAHYHLQPSNETLVWDRLPMTVAFMTLFSAVIADRVSWRIGVALLWPLVIAGLASIGWWVRTEADGAGDLRPYAVVQFLPMLLIPLILVTWPKSGMNERLLWMALAAYAAAKIAEWLDLGIFDLTGLSGGHALKHLLAALAAWWIVRSFQMSPASAL
jgi:Ceramidase